MSGIPTLFMVALIVVAVFLILVVLVQRGRGGGLAGALGGMGGQSAFGTKAGDTFTKITIWAAAVWILLCVAGVMYLNGAAANKQNQLAAPVGKSHINAETEGDGKGAATTPRTRVTPEKGGATAPKETPPPPPAPPATKDGKNP